MTGKQFFKLFFHTDTIIPFFALAFLWLGISGITDATLSIEKLNLHSGTLNGIDSAIVKVKDKPLFKEITKKLYLHLEGGDTWYTTITTADFGNITPYLQIGDSISIFTKPRAWGIFGLQERNNIAHLVKGEFVLIDFTKFKRNLPAVSLLALGSFILFAIIFWLRIRKRLAFDI